MEYTDGFIMKKLLLIEPDTALRQLYKSLLSGEGYDVCVCKDGQQAIELADNSVPDCIIMELFLPGQNGIGFLYELRSYPEWRCIPVILHTFVNQNKLSAKTRTILGVTDFLHKLHSTPQSLLLSVNNLFLEQQGTGAL